MPRVSGIYSRPTGIDAVPNNTIDSGKYNSNVADVEADLNLPRPIVAGGTGATNAIDARNNLDAEVAMATVTNYDSHVFENGSFWSDSAATGAPIATHTFSGFALVVNNDQNFVFITVFDSNDVTTQPGRIWQREKRSGVWSAWTLALSEATNFANTKVAKAGDTMTGDLGIAKAQPALLLNKAASTQGASIYGMTANSLRWLMQLGDGTPEGGGNTGSHFVLGRFNDAGSGLTNPLTINRTTGNAIFSGGAGFGGISVGTAPGSSNTLTGLECGVDYLLVSRTTGPNAGHNINNDGTQIFFYRSGVPVGSINSNTVATSYNTSSDGELKEDLKEVSASEAGRIVDETAVYDFRWKATGERGYGVIAQQAAQIYATPAFHDEKEDRWYIDYSKYIPIVLNELKALRKRVAELEGKLTEKP